MTAQRFETGPPAITRQTPRADPSGAGTDDRLARLLADVAHLDQVPLDSHFFNDLGADSLVMAHFCARVRKRPDLPSISMRDIYRHPTINGLTEALTPPAPAVSAQEDRAATPVEDDHREDHRHAPTGRPHYILCAVLQLLSFLGYASFLAFVTTRGYDWVSAGTGLFDPYVRSVEFGASLLLVLCALPVIAKWLLVGKWKTQRFRVWSLAYVRFWLVKTLIRSSPMVLFAGSPLYPLYLRALGARIGRGVTLLSRSVPVCTDLLTIGDKSIVRKDSLVSCYRARDGAIETGPVTLGSNAVVSEATVLDIGSSLGDDSQLGHASSLHTGQRVPDGEHWHGSPAQPADADFQNVEPARCGTGRRAVNGVVLLLMSVLVYVPLAVGFLDAVLSRVLEGSALLQQAQAALTGWMPYVDALVITAVTFSGAVLAGLAAVATVPRLLSKFLTPGRTYPLFGFHHGLHRAIVLLGNRISLTRLFGDSSGIVHYLRWLGYDLSRVEQTGSNFGTRVKQESPFVSAVGTGTMVADGLSLLNADYSSTSFRLSRTSIGAHNFLGNRIAYPSRGRTGDNCLLATKVMVPVDGPLRQDVGLLGSPSFEIPRTVLRDSTFDELKEGENLRVRLGAKNRHNVLTMLWYLFTGWLFFFCVTVLFGFAASLYPQWGTGAIIAANVVVLPFTLLYFVLVERVVTMLHPLRPLFCSIYDRRFWRRERYWKVPSETYLQALNGTPFKNVVLRLLGSRIGARVFDDGCSFTERPMVTVGDDCTLNAGSIVQCHSQEDGTFKSDRSAIGSDCTLGVGALVHYGVTIGDGAALAADSFLMKGETVPEHARWTGNPAHPELDCTGGDL
ncbi:Pls/PosA family non-ribosomal peptide synthetase [Streptomyces fuscigenes]|uniref:Pls/PosA family non-ribosomal peptide synthetase n=1 Tax=Streptomyces fuscigenes TaxID=1528880 RepID=UPI001F3189BD|nr:Pls/PosA family non-ribosomal peptide synthetase [Streptomyces fuscigenes]MCF3960205.1 phosphopantetheine-binding protein [Streptomyces fuscigenes]